MSEIKTITRDDYLRLVGLMTLAKDHNRLLRDIERAAARLVNEDPDPHGGGEYYGHVTDAVGEDCSADEMLRRMEITVEKDSP